MSAVTIELLPQKEQIAFNLRRWDELLADPELAKIEGRNETDRHGQVTLSPPPSASHGRLEFRIATMLENLLPHGEAQTECPISTADGIKAADAAWASHACIAELGNRACFPRSPDYPGACWTDGNVINVRDAQRASIR
jgi:hypothetical protein